MKSLNATLATLLAGLTLAIAVPSADAARLGGGRSVGAQRPIAQRQALPPQPQAAPAQAPAPAQPKPAGASRWLGPLAGLAAGLGLGWLFANGGMGSLFGPILMGLAVAFIGMMIVRKLSRSRAPAGAAGSSYGGVPGAQYSGLGNETVAAPPPSQIPGNDVAWGGGGSNAGQAAAAGQQVVVPPGFDVAGFLKQAKLNFIRLQEANDRQEFDALRDVTTDTLYDSLTADLKARGSAAQHTDVVALEATLLEVVTENNAHWASVKFSGQIREQAGAAPSPFAEVWHLTKPASGDLGWLIAGIEQIS